MSSPNPENGGFIYRVMPSQVSCAQQATGYPASNLTTSNPNQIFMTNGGNTININIVFGTTTTISGVAFINHSIPAGATIELQFFLDSWITIAEIVEVNWSNKNTYKVFNIKNYQRINIKITNIGSPIYIGELVLGTSFQFPYNYEWGFEESFNVVKEVVTSDEGIHFEVPSTCAPEYSKFKIKFSNSPSNNLSLFYDVIRIGKKVFIPDMTQPDCYFGIVPDKELNATRTHKGDEYSIRFWEDAISGIYI